MDNPFDRLFGAKPFLKPRTQPLFKVDPNGFRAPSQKPHIVCGMVVLPADGSIDPEFVREIPKDAPKGTMRVVPAPSCEKIMR